MNVLDLFSGIGGFSLGLEATGGFRTMAFCEIEPYCQAVLRKHWPSVPCHSDITKLDATPLRGRADVICGGFPCQDISTAGKGAGITGSRSGLWTEYARIIDEVRPRYVIVENVAALLSRGLGRVLGDLAALGYDAEWNCIPASAVGAPHRRDRVWIVAYTGRERSSGRRKVRNVGCTEAKSESQAQEWQWLRDASDDSRTAMAHTESLRRQWGWYARQRWNGFKDSGENVVAYSAGFGREGSGMSPLRCSPKENEERKAVDAFSGSIGHQWSVEPNVGRVADGIPNRVDRLRSLGNSIVPQIAQIIGEAIMMMEAA
jgi:DNA (cytosine-5)-methyltransferase 1